MSHAGTEVCYYEQIVSFKAERDGRTNRQHQSASTNVGHSGGTCPMESIPKPPNSFVTQ